MAGYLEILTMRGTLTEENAPVDLGNRVLQVIRDRPGNKIVTLEGTIAGPMVDDSPMCYHRDDTGRLHGTGHIDFHLTEDGKVRWIAYDNKRSAPSPEAMFLDLIESRGKVQFSGTFDVTIQRFLTGTYVDTNGRRLGFVYYGLRIANGAIEFRSAEGMCRCRDGADKDRGVVYGDLRDTIDTAGVS